MAAPWTLLRAELDGAPQPLNAGADGSTGVELRAVQLALQASSRVPSGGEIRVSGWDQTFARVDTTLHLPPGQILLAAPGADYAPHTWLANWNLLDLFLVLITGMLLGRLLGHGWGLLGLVLLALAYPDYPTLLYLLAGAAAAQLLHRAVGGNGAFARAIGTVYRGLLIGLVLAALPFIAGQLRLALYPQLELYQIDQAQPLHRSIAHTGYDMAEAAAGPSFESRKFADGGAVLDRVAPDRAAPVELRPAAEISPQALAGPGEPDWSWRRAELSWSGPVVAEQTLRLIILPRWLTGLLRVLSVLILAALCWRWFRAQPPLPQTENRNGGAAALGMVVLSGLLLTPPQTSAAETALPSPEQLQELREWLLRPPACAPACVEVPALTITVEGTTVLLQVDVHAEAAAGLALPRVQPDWQLLELKVDGVEVSSLRQSGNQRWLWLPRGVHRLELRAALTEADTVALQFANPPRSVRADTGPGWSITGISDGGLAGDTLELRRERPVAGAVSDTPVLSRRGLDARPFYRVDRQLHLGSEWRLSTSVQRLAPASGNLALTVPLWPGENPLDDSLTVRNGADDQFFTMYVKSIFSIPQISTSYRQYQSNKNQWKCP
jgi:hypothetical protein